MDLREAAGKSATEPAPDRPRISMSARFSWRRTWARAWRRRFRQGVGWFFLGAHAALLFPARADAQALAWAGSHAQGEALPYEEWHGERVAPRGALAAPEPLPLSRPVELSRKPVELASEGGISLPLCAAGARVECAALGAAFGGALLASYRPSPYFAAGGALSFRTATGRERGTLEERVLALGARLRVYLVEQGELDPYLELGFGFAEVQSGRGSVVESRLGPFAEVGGGTDVLMGQSWRIGAGVTLSEVFVAGTGSERRVGAVFRLGFSFGEAL